MNAPLLCRDVMKRLAQDLEGAGSAEWPGVGYVQIDGSMDQCDRRKACQSFRSDPAIRVALLSVMAAGKRPISEAVCMLCLHIAAACAAL